MLPLQIAGQVLLQDLNPLIVMYYTRGTSKHRPTEQVFGKVLISNLQDILDESAVETINYLAVCACKNEIIAIGKVYMISTLWLH